MKKIFCFVAMCLLCTGCGPKSVGDGTSEPAPSAAPVAGDHLRYPMMGNRIQQRLYIFNQPGMMENIIESQRNMYLRKFGDTEAPNDYKNLQPRQASPFRQ